MTTFKDRVPYSAIIDRPPLELPDGARMAVWTIVNVEHWDCAGVMPRTVLPPPMDKPLLPDLPNWAWHEYGMRVGFWRIHECLTRLGVVPTMAVNGIVCENCPRIAEAALEAGWEFMGHGLCRIPCTSSMTSAPPSTGPWRPSTPLPARRRVAGKALA